MKLASMIKVGNNAALAIAVEFMKNNHRDNFGQALIYITTRINELNANSKSSAASCNTADFLITTTEEMQWGRHQ